MGVAESPGLEVDAVSCNDCLTAKKRFRKGDRVVLSLDGCRAISEFIERKSAGVIVGFA